MSSHKRHHRRRRKAWQIPTPVTERKIRNRGWTPIVYITDAETRFGWLVEESGSIMRVAFPHAERCTIVRGEDRRFVFTLDAWRADNSLRVSA